MINASNIVFFNFIETSLCSLIWYHIIYLFETASIMFLSYILFDLLDDEHGITEKGKM